MKGQTNKKRALDEADHQEQPRKKACAPLLTAEDDQDDLQAAIALSLVPAQAEAPPSAASQDRRLSLQSAILDSVRLQETSPEAAPQQEQHHVPAEGAQQVQSAAGPTTPSAEDESSFCSICLCGGEVLKHHRWTTGLRPTIEHCQKGKECKHLICMECRQRLIFTFLATPTMPFLECVQCRKADAPVYRAHVDSTVFLF